MADIDPMGTDDFRAVLEAAREKTVALRESAEAVDEPDEPSYTPVEGVTGEADVEEGLEEDEPEDENEEPVAEGEEEPDEDLSETQKYLQDKYGGDVDKAIKSLQHAERKLGEQGNELGQRRQLESQVQELQQTVAQLMQARNTQPVQAVDEDWVEEQMEDPAGAAQWALENRRMDLYEAIMDRWAEDEPRQATRFETTKYLEAERYRQSQELEQVRQPVQRNQVTEAFADAWADLRTEYPGLDSVADDVAAEAQHLYETGMPEFMQVLTTSTDVPKLKQTLEALLLMSNSRKSGTLTKQQIDNASAVADEAAKTKRRSAVTKPSGTGGERRAPKKSASETLKAKLLDNPTDIRAGITVDER